MIMNKISLLLFFVLNAYSYAKNIYVDSFIQNSTVDVNTKIQKAFDFAQNGDNIIFGANKIYDIRSVYLNSKKGIKIVGKGATLRVITNKGDAYYQDAGAIGLYSCSDIDIIDLIIDGQRQLQDSSGFSMGIFIGKTQNSPIFFKDNGGENKPSKNICIENCTFTRTGKPNKGIDTFGDGVSAHFVDGLTVKNCLFEDVGRWAVAVSESYNVSIENNVVNNPNNGTALGSFDIENEGEDFAKGSYSKNITIKNNRLSGRAAVYLVTGYRENFSPKGKYGIENVDIINNTFSVSKAKDYADDAIYIIAKSKNSRVEVPIRNVNIINNIFHSNPSLRYAINLASEDRMSQFYNINIQDNTFNNFSSAINVETGYSETLNYVLVENNTFKQDNFCDKMLNGRTSKIILRNNKVL